MFWLSVLGFLVFNSFLVAHAHYTNKQVQHCFEGLVHNKTAQLGELEARDKLDELFSVQYLEKDDLPVEFYDQLRIKVSDGMIEVSSSYGVTIWPFGKVEHVDESGEYDPESLNDLDILRDKTRIDLSFEPYAITSSDSP
ncbi:MAG: hypothetical protein Q9M08_02790 [Mariprofundus sp.]|nr:hypothetical protein [Mariprofundus sp.]